MVRMRASAIFSGLLLVFLGCQTSARQELKNFVADLQKSADEVRKDGKPGIYTLEVLGGESGLCLLPAHGSAAHFGLSGRVIGQIDQLAASSDTGHVFLIRDNHVVSDEALDPTLVVSPSYSHKREIQFKMAPSKQNPQIVDISLIGE